MAKEPTRVIAVRLPESVATWWEARAKTANRTLGAHLRAKLTEPTLAPVPDPQKAPVAPRSREVTPLLKR